VDVLAGAVGVQQQRVLREVREQAQLNLRVVRRHQQVARRGDERGANLAAERGADGDVLQVGVDAGEPAGRRAHLVEGGVDARVGVGECGQRVEVGALELLELAVLEDERGDLVMRGEVFEHVLRGGDDLALALLGRLGQVHLVEEHVAELLGRVDVEAVAGAGVDALGEVVDGDGEARGHLAQQIGVDADAGLLHAEEHGDEREVDVLVDVGECRNAQGFRVQGRVQKACESPLWLAGRWALDPGPCPQRASPC
jgi:hypothetical protein